MHRFEGSFAITSLPDGTELLADLNEQPGQAHTAELLGCSVAEMNYTHDLFHSKLAMMLDLPYSPALWAAAHDEQTTELHGFEEDAVLAIQKFAFAAWRKLKEKHL